MQPITLSITGTVVSLKNKTRTWEGQPITAFEINPQTLDIQCQCGFWLHLSTLETALKLAEVHVMICPQCEGRGFLFFKDASEVPHRTHHA